MPSDKNPSRAAAASAAEGLRLRREGRLEEALAAARAATKAPAELPLGRAAAGEILRDLGARRRGYGELQRALQLDPEAACAAPYLKDGADREDAWAFALKGGALRAKNDLPGARALLERAVALDAGCGWAWGWLGELLLRQDSPAAALPALTRAVGLFAEWPEAFAWRGEALRLLGRFEEASRDLDHAVALGLKRYDVFLSRASAREALGDAAGRERDLASAVRCEPELFKAQARETKDASASKWIEEVLGGAARAKTLLSKAAKEAGAGKHDAAVRTLELCLAADASAGEAHRLLADVRSAQGRGEAALEHADAAVKADPCADSYAKRADLAQRLGYMESSLRDLSLAVALGPSASLHQWRARSFLGMRHYDLALRDITTALELDPENVELFDLRAHVNLLLGRVHDARADVELALKVAPGQVNLHLRLGQLLSLGGKFDEARASAAPIAKKAPAWAAFIRGYALSLEKKWEEAGKHFAEAEKLAEERDGALKRQAGFYGTVARAFGGLGRMDAMAQKTAKKAAAPKKGGSPEKSGKVYLCGLGVYPPQTATVEVLRGISECDVIFNNLPGMGISEFLGLFCPNRRPVAFRYEQDAKLCADLVLSEVKPGRTVGFVTFGHPLLFGPLSHEIIKRCAKEGVPVKAFGAVSSMDAVLAASGQVLGYSYPGFQVFETTGARVLSEIPSANPNLPVVVYFAEGLGDKGMSTMIEMLEKLYSPAHKCLLFGPKHELWETQQEGVTLKELAKISHHKLAQGILFVPPK